MSGECAGEVFNAWASSGTREKFMASREMLGLSWDASTSVLRRFNFRLFPTAHEAIPPPHLPSPLSISSFYFIQHIQLTFDKLRRLELEPFDNRFEIFFVDGFLLSPINETRFFFVLSSSEDVSCIDDGRLRFVLSSSALLVMAWAQSIWLLIEDVKCSSVFFFFVKGLWGNFFKITSKLLSTYIFIGWWW